VPKNSKCFLKNILYFIAINSDYPTEVFMEYTVFLQLRESGGFVALVPAIPGCQSLGTTEEEAIRNISVNIKD
jgi:hypothetical protein